MGRPMTPGQDVPEGYTPEEWASAIRISELLDLGPTDIAPRFDVGVAIPEVEQTYRKEVGRGGYTVSISIPNKTYLIQCGDFVKIGIASSVHNRLRALQAMNPLPLKVLVVLAGGRDLERALHARFAAYRHRDEWFRIEGDLSEWIAAGFWE